MHATYRRTIAALFALAFVSVASAQAGVRAQMVVHGDDISNTILLPYSMV